MQITAVHCTNFKRLREIELRPDADRAVILIGGKNANGKSSLLDALTTAFGGKRAQPADPVRHGADEATIRVELDGGNLEVRRVIRPDGESVLEVRDRFGALKSPQAMLDQLIGARFLDPLAFLSLAPKEQRAQLMRVIPGADQIIALDGERGQAFDRRTEIGRDLKRAEGELTRMPEVTVGTAIDVEALTTESRELAAKLRTGQELAAKHRERQRETADAQTGLDRTRNELEHIEAELKRLADRAFSLRASIVLQEEGVDERKAAEVESQRAVEQAAASWNAEHPRRERINEDLRRAGEHNRQVYAAEAQAKRRAEVTADVERLGKERAEHTKLIETIDQRKGEILAAAKLPVEGLAINDDGIQLGGVPFAQASDAERWRVALAIAVAASPGLSDVWIRDGALLDEESLALVAEHAAAAGKRVWIERVGTSDPGVIEIRDGRVRAPANDERDGGVAA